MRYEAVRYTRSSLTEASAPRRSGRRVLIGISDRTTVVWTHENSFCEASNDAVSDGEKYANVIRRVAEILFQEQDATVPGNAVRTGPVSHMAIERQPCSVHLWG